MEVQYIPSIDTECLQQYSVTIGKNHSPEELPFGCCHHIFGETISRQNRGTPHHGDQGQVWLFTGGR